MRDSRTPPGANASRIAITFPATLGGVPALTMPCLPDPGIHNKAASHRTGPVERDAVTRISWR
ncbi:hypothetical protein Airi02_056130 [Actinoallomurus iriomotensis]|uniref:Uncharacterized protein n=1 Tax=Actinoallomurus iriomotensis TaxID=478107 RepID=A0A9W6W1S1_9ACTN|nr:hypothetical protein Airi02_056130 [Actinoallomurus iriomotensis]